MIHGEFKAHCDTTACSTSIDLKSRTEDSTKREIHSLGWSHDRFFLNLKCPECQNKQTDQVKDFLDNIDDPI